MPTVTDIAADINAAISGDVDVRGDGDIEITGLGPIDTATPGQITHLSSAAYRRFLPETKASAVLLRSADVDDCPVVAVVVPDPYLAFALVSQQFDDAPRLRAGVDVTASVDPTAQLDPTVAVGANASIAADVVLGPRVEIGAGSRVGAGTRIGADSVVHPNATLYHGVTLGERCVIHSGAVIGADGFGFAPDERGRWVTIAQLGGVTLGDDVVVGACSTIDRGAITNTVLRDGVKIDNQVQIGHNCDIGEHTLICGRVGIVGSTKIGRHCVFAGGAGVAGDRPVTICDNVQVASVTTISRSIDTPGVYAGSLLHNTVQRWRRNAVRFAELDDLAKRLARLEQERRA
ncbi:MAG: UDP-3-O-(3-hydroxymyristoyl)glucosamine N-acyltransferase [Gammaproteobacteria bacterium]|nr:UDP-3-O-(3-hydroxymyristoyl)glucosamine N-acyltransferase [Gammaproteobacteria bacterium]MYK48166.1 UDP-3-O-(3-hydroxymyristoyl)glucosamine N-acyltransferase [Gammaproteobacteria bacterium]